MIRAVVTTGQVNVQTGWMTIAFFKGRASST